jgi:[acyl-carrier-protein] S-malonyltransferase
MKKKVIKNIDATEYKENDDFVEILSKHVISPVKFKDSIEKMINLGVDTFIEIGPRKSFIRLYKENQ